MVTEGLYAVDTIVLFLFFCLASFKSDHETLHKRAVSLSDLASASDCSAFNPVQFSVAS